MSTKVLRIIVACICLVIFPFLLFAPIAEAFFTPISFIPEIVDALGSGLLSAVLGAFDLLGGAILIFIVVLITVLLLLTGAILAFIPSVKPKVASILCIIANAIAVCWVLFILIGFLAGDRGGLIGWGIYVTLVLSIGGLVFSIMLACKKEQIHKPVYNQPPSPSIIGLSGTYQNARFSISNGMQIMMGRDPSACQIVFDQFDTAVSRVHCTVTFIQSTNMYSVRDESKNGTYVGSTSNRMPSHVEQMLPRGSVIILGSSKNSFRLD